MLRRAICKLLGVAVPRVDLPRQQCVASLWEFTLGGDNTMTVRGGPSNDGYANLARQVFCLGIIFRDFNLLLTQAAAALLMVMAATWADEHGSFATDLLNEWWVL